MTVVRYSATGRKTPVKVDLDKYVFSEKVDSHELLNQVYLSYMANGRANLARTKTRGEVRGGGRKPWRQKGLGRARHGSIRSPIWKGGGVTFGPIGKENYSKTVNKKAKRKALRQALTLAVKSGKFKVVETFTQMDKKTKDMASFLEKVDANGRILCVVSEKDPAKEKAARNIPNLKISAAKYLNTYDILNADTILISDKSLEIVNQGLKGAKK